ncbi:MAG: histidinol dehydrogenase [Nitrososphaeria archaeon]
MKHRLEIYYLNRENITRILNNIRGRRELFKKEIEDNVAKIVEDVRKRGDKALIDYTKAFDNMILSKNGIKVGRDEIDDAYNHVDRTQIDALKTLKENIERVEKENFNRMFFEIENDGFKIVQTLKPLESVGCYVPGGEASYPSTLLMATVPAKVAGVNRIVVVSPPKKMSPTLLVAADLAGVNEIYRVGGVQAIAALAYGTETIRPVDKIVGPGGTYVSIAKAVVSHDVPIDMLAGPSELVVYADEESDPKQIVLDLIAQAEHSSDTLCGLVTTSSKLIEKVLDCMREYLPVAFRKDIVTVSIEGNGFIVLAEDEKIAVEFINRLSPEHLEIFSKDYKRLLEEIENVGAITVNGSSVLTDYYCGINHILPTNGQAKFRGGLSCLDFVKVVRAVIAPVNYSIKTFSVVNQLGACEGLLNHVKSLNAKMSAGDKCRQN